MARLRERALQAPIILWASHATSRLRSRAVAAGFQAVREKPLLINILLDTLCSIVDPNGGAVESAQGWTVKVP
jgi:hypothetical protein